MSKRWGLDTEDVKSIARHTIFPIISGGAVAGLEIATQGGASFQTIKNAFFTAIGSGIIGFLKRWTTQS